MVCLMLDICLKGIYRCIHVGKYDNPPPLLPLRPTHKFKQCPCIGWACKKNYPQPFTSGELGGN